MALVLGSALIVATCSTSRGGGGGDNGGGGGGGGGGDHDTGGSDVAQEDAGPSDTGQQPFIREGGIVVPDCTDGDRDGYGNGPGCRGADFDDTDHRVYPGAPEICDGKDNDNNGAIDALDEDNFAPEACGRTKGVCRGTHAECTDGVSQLPCDPAVYGPDFLEEEDLVCDGRDNDCDGDVDEGCECIDGTKQLCPDDACAERTCANGAWLPCVNFRNPEQEECNGVDNDCDGETDERDGIGPSLCGRCPFEMLEVDTVNLDLCIDRWEASRPDATEEHPGFGEDVAPTSRPGVLPWVAVARGKAVGACKLAGKELCNAAQWQHACKYIGFQDVNPNWVFPYGESYVPDRCNGDDAGNGRVLPTGSMAECVVESERAAYDLSGNVREWIYEKIDGERAAFGGSFESTGEALSCESYESIPASTEDLKTGFRCCKPLQNY